MGTAQRRRGPFGLLVRGLSSSVTGNAQAFGFSITVTVTFGVVDSAEGTPSRLDLVGFALSAVAAFSLLNLLVAHLVRHQPEAAPPTRALLVGTATDIVAVGAAVGVAIATTTVLAGWGVWLLAPFCSSVAYVLVQAVELAVGQDEADDA